jgi:hypothetical protein
MAKKAGVASQSSKAEDAKEEVAKSDPSIFLKSGKLWPKPLTLIGGSGKHESGKTLFGLSICPGPQTLVYDFEDSSKPYVDQIGFEMIDVPDLMIKKYNRIAQEETFCWWRDHILSQPTGKHRVLMVDPISDIEAGLKMWVQKRPQDFGYTSNQFARMEGVLWECVKAYWKSLLLQIANRVETFYFVAHTKREWVGNTPTPNLLPRGKQTLFELSSLYLFFDRTPVDGRKPQKPAANVLKSRVVEAKIVNGELVATAVLPPRLPEATPQAIRHYMLHPGELRQTRQARAVGRPEDLRDRHPRDACRHCRVGTGDGITQDGSTVVARATQSFGRPGVEHRPRCARRRNTAGVDENGIPRPIRRGTGIDAGGRNTAANEPRDRQWRLAPFDAVFGIRRRRTPSPEDRRILQSPRRDRRAAREDLSEAKRRCHSAARSNSDVRAAEGTRQHHRREGGA